MYGILIRESDKNCIPGNYILKQQIDSKSNVQSLLSKLVFENSSTEKTALYFPFTAQAMKVDSVFWRCISTLAGCIIDLVTLPYRAFSCALQTDRYKTELKEILPLYQYLKEKNVAQKYLEQNRFEVTFYFDPETNDAAYVNDTVQGNRYNSYVIDLFKGVIEQKRGGNEEKAQALRQELWQPLVAKA